MLVLPCLHPAPFGTALLAPHSADSRFNLSTSGWEPVTPGSPPLRFRFFANYARGSPVPLKDLGSSTVAAGILLPLSVVDNQGEEETTVVSMLEVYVAAENYGKAREEMSGIRAILQRRRPFLERVELRLAKYQSLVEEIQNDDER